MLLRPSYGKDFTMMYFNSDGFEGTMCGNGGRCLVRFANDCGYVQKTENIIFDAIDGEHSAHIINSGYVSLKMKNVSIVERRGSGWGLNTGSMHHVEYVDNLMDMDVYRAGSALRGHKMYAPDGCNVNFIEVDNQDNIMIRTYERGVENETLACGTGSVAAAIVHHNAGYKKDKYIIKARGGTLAVSFEFVGGEYRNIWLEGPADLVFEGVWTDERF